MQEPLRTRSESETMTGEPDERVEENQSRLYGFLRGYFRKREYDGLQRALNQSRAGIRYDKYLARRMTRSVGVGTAVAVGVFLAVFFFGPVSETGALVGGAVAGVVLGGVVVALGYGLAQYLPRARARRRARRINLLLPQAISYLYALSAGGNDITRTIRSVAEEDETYGEISREFDYVIRDIDYFGNDPLTALENLREITPSGELRVFLDDLVSTLESGGSVSDFLRAESDKYFDRAQTQQKSFLERLATLAEVYVGAAVVGPLFLVIVLLLIDLLGANVTAVLYISVYVIIPALLVGILGAAYYMSSGYGEITVRPSPRSLDPPEEADFEDDRLGRYRNRRWIGVIRSLLLQPVSYIEHRPVRVLWFSIPIGVLTALGTVWLGVVSVSTATMADQPVRTTTALVVVPFLVAFAPLSVIHERRRRRQNQIVQRFPDFLNQLSTANDMGLNVSEALALVGRRSEGHLATEVEQTANDSYWTGDFSGSLARMSERIGSARAARSLTLVGTASQISGNISRVLDVAARDSSNTARLRESRLQEMQTYTAIVAIAFLIYLAIVLLLEVTFLETFAELTDELEETGDSPFEFGDTDSGIYRMLLFHSALIQAVGNGLIAGKMGQNSMLSGLKYCLILTVITVGAYAVVLSI